MDEFVLGENVILRALDETSGDYLPFLCSTTCSLQVTTELIDTTATTNGKYNAYRPTFTDATLSLSGITYIEHEGIDGFTVFDTTTEQLRNSGLNIEMSFTDQQARTRSIRMFVYITDTIINGDVEDFSDYEIEFQASGGYEIENFITPTSSEVGTVEYTATGGETSFTDPELVGRTIIEFTRAGIGKQVITAGTPNDMQAKYSSGLGKMEVAATNPFMPGEYCLVIYST
jgi:hypothetical protein